MEFFEDLGCLAIGGLLLAAVFLMVGCLVVGYFIGAATA